MTLFTHTGPQPSAEEAQGLAARDIAVVDGEVEALEIEAGRLRGVRLASEEVIARRVLVVATTVAPRADILGTLGLEAAEHPLGMGRSIDADPTGQISVPGVWVAGNASAPAAWVAAAASSGVMAGAAINNHLIADDIRVAVEQAAALREAA